MAAVQAPADDRRPCGRMNITLDVERKHLILDVDVPVEDVWQVLEILRQLCPDEFGGRSV